MIRLCIILDTCLYQVNLTPGSTTPIHTPLSKWHPARPTATGDLLLPGGWSCPDGLQPDRISLLTEGNFLLAHGHRNALAMVRHVAEQSLPTEQVQLSGRITVGRSRKNAICCQDGYLSSSHGIFSFTRYGQLRYEDASTNGTFVNDELVQGEARILQSGDRLDFPPLMQVTVDGVSLRVRYPREHGQLTLPPMPAAAEGELLAAVYIPESGHLAYVRLPVGILSGAELLQSILSQLPAPQLQLLPSEPVLRFAGETALISPTALVQVQEGTTLVLT